MGVRMRRVVWQYWSRFYVYSRKFFIFKPDLFNDRPVNEHGHEAK
jgi:hypothetical protein